MLYTNCTPYLVKYLHRIFGAKTAICSVCLRETEKEKTIVEYFPQHQFKCKFKLTMFNVAIPLCAVFLYNATNFLCS